MTGTRVLPTFFFGAVVIVPPLQVTVFPSTMTD
jgi:hypothetical protein